MSSVCSGREFMVLFRYGGNLVEALKTEDVTSLCQNLYERVVISKEVKDKFASLDHDNLKTELMVRYLLQHVYDAVKDNKLAFYSFLDVLSEVEGGVADELRRELHRYELAEMGENQASQSDVSVGMKISQASLGDYRVLSEEDVTKLTELLANVSNKAEELGLSLGLHKSQIIKCQEGCSWLSNVLLEWVRSSSEPCTIRRLKEALPSNVNSNNMASQLEEHFLANELQPMYRSDDTKVASGKAALLGFLVASNNPVKYLWRKNGQPLSDNEVYSGTHSPILFIRHVGGQIEGQYDCRVYSEGYNVKNSGEIKLTECYSVTKQFLRFYSNMFGLPQDSWPPVTNTEFINLALITKTRRTNDVFFDYSVQGDMDDIIAAKENVEYSEVFGKYESGALVLVEGRPGSGKTTLLHKITRDWALKRNILLGAEIVVLVPLRLLFGKSSKDVTLSEILQSYIENDDERIRLIKMIMERNGEGLCFIFDGLNEYECCDDHSTLIYKLIHKYFLPLSMVIVASRPVGTASVRHEAVTKRIEVLGFSRIEIYEYIECYPWRSDDVAGKLKSFLNLHVNVLHMCYLPMHIAMICFLFSQLGDDMPQTETKIYESLTLLLITRKLKRENFDSITIDSLQDLRENVKEYFLIICKLAFEMIVHSKLAVFQSQTSFPLSTHDSDIPSLGLLTIDTTARFFNVEHVYTFLHLTFQEYLAAYHIAKLDHQTQTEIILAYGNNPEFLKVWKFFSGIAKFHDTVVLNNLLSNKAILYKVQCAFESQQQIFCDSVFELDETDTLSLKDDTLISTDFLAICYVIATTHYFIRRLTFTNCRLDREGVALFLVKMSTVHLNNIRYLGYHKQKCTVEQFETLNMLLKKLSSLEILDLDNTELGVEGVKTLTENVELPNLRSLKIKLPLKKNIHNEAEILKLLRCCSTKLEQVQYKYPKSKSYLESRFHIMNMSYAFSGSFCCNPYYGFISYCNSVLHLLAPSSVEYFQRCSKLVLINCGITDNEIKLLVESMTICTKLDTLHLDFNRITSKGATLLSTSLEKYTKFEIFSAHCNQIDDFGALSIASALVQLNNPKILDLQCNPITEGGTSAVIKIVKDLSIDFQLYISTNINKSLDKSNLKLVQQSVDLICGDNNIEAVYRALECCRFLPEGVVRDGIISNIHSVLQLLQKDDIPVHSETIEKNWVQKHIPKIRLGSLNYKSYCENIDFLLLTLSDQGYNAATTYLQRPNIEDNTADNTATSLDTNIAVGSFAGAQVALIKVSAGKDTNEAMIEAKIHFPQVKYVISIDTCYGFHQSEIKLGDVLISSGITNVTSCDISSADSTAHIVINGTFVAMKDLLQHIFCTDSRLEEKFEISSFRSAKYLVCNIISNLEVTEDFRMHNKSSITIKIEDSTLHNSITVNPNAVGINTGSIKLLQLQKEEIIKEFIVIESVIGYVGETSNNKWKFTGAMAALCYVQQKMTDYMYHKISVDTYLSALKSHKEDIADIMVAKLIFLGPSLQGKTVTRQRLTNVIKNIISSTGNRDESNTGVSEQSTVICKDTVHITAFTANDGTWREIGIEEECQLCLNSLYLKSEDTEYSLPSTNEEVEVKVPSPKCLKITSTLDKVSKVSDITETQPRRKESAIVEMPKFPAASLNWTWEDIRNILEKGNKNFKLKSDGKCVLYVQDTGGQPELMECLPALTIGPALYLLFCKLNVNLDDHFKIGYRGSDGSTPPSLSHFTIKDSLVTALASIASMTYSCAGTNITEQRKNREGCVHLVGTHRDKVDNDTIDKFESDIQELLKSTVFYKRGLVKWWYEKDLPSDSGLSNNITQRIVYPLDNMFGENKEIQYLQTSIYERLKSLFGKKKIPNHWLLFGICLRRCPKSVVNLESCFDLGEMLNLSKEETRSALHFFHYNLGICMHFSNITPLKDIVITNTQSVYKCLSTLIEAAFKPGEVEPAAAEEFKNTGVFSTEIFESLLDHILRLDVLIQILVHLNVVAQIPSTAHQRKKYFMPCILQNASDKEIDEYQERNPIPGGLSPLFVRYKCGFVPLGVFPAMIAHFYHQVSQEGLPYLDFRKDHLKRNHIQFLYGVERDIITFVYKPQFIRVHISRQRNCDSKDLLKVCLEIRTLVKNTLRNVTASMLHSLYTVASQEQYRYDFEPYQFAFDYHDPSGDEHFCVVHNKEEDPKYMGCVTHENCEPFKMEQRHLCWYGKEFCQPEPHSREASSLSMGSFIVLKWKDESGVWQSMRILDKVCNSWKDIAELIGLESSRIKAIETVRLLDPKECCRDVFNDWLTQGKGKGNYEANLEGLQSLMEDIKHGTLAKKLKDALPCMVKK